MPGRHPGSLVAQQNQRDGNRDMKAKQSDRTGEQGVALVKLRLEKIGFAMREQTSSDYGIDAIAELIDDETATGRLVAIQIKSGAS